MNSSEPNQIAVAGCVLNAGYAAQHTVRFVMSRGKRRTRRRHDWLAHELDPDGVEVRTETVFEYRLGREPLLGLAARGAAALWGKYLRPNRRGGRCHGLRIEVTVGDELDTVAELRMGTWGVYSGQSVREGKTLKWTHLYPPGDYDFGHFLRLTLCQLAFNDAFPPPCDDALTAPVGLPSFWISNSLNADNTEQTRNA